MAGERLRNGDKAREASEQAEDQQSVALDVEGSLDALRVALAVGFQEDVGVLSR